MKKTVWVTILLVLALSACTKSASKVPSATATGNVPFPTPLADNNALKTIQSQTQTAQTVAPKTTAAPATATLAPAATSAQKPAEKPAATAAPTKAAPDASPTPVPPTATQKPVVIAPTATPGRPAAYTLQSGEFPYCIARRFNVNPADLMSLNGMGMTDKPLAGTILKIPASGSWPGERALQAHPASYVVKTNDNVYGIACLFGDADPDAIITANGLSGGFALSPGETLQIP